MHTSGGVFKGKGGRTICMTYCSTNSPGSTCTMKNPAQTIMAASQDLDDVSVDDVSVDGLFDVV